MKASCILRSPILAPIYSIFNSTSRPYFTPISSSFSSSSSSSSSLSPILTQTPQPKPKTPLFLTPPTHKTPLSDIQTFHNWAKLLISSVGSTFEAIDDGPNSSILQRELKWLLEDISEDPSLFSQLGISQNLEFHPKKVVPLRVSLDQLYKLWDQRINERKPFQYIVGCEHWRDLVLSVQEGVLIPRPETGKVVDLVEYMVGKCGGLLSDGLWCDLGTGSGALAIGIARVLSDNGRVIATDLSPVAVSVAKYNVDRYGLQDKIEVRQGSWFEPLTDVEGELSGIVSNPPYIPSKDISGLQAEVGKHEPILALDGGVEGVDHLIHLLETTSTMLKPGGFFAFETNGEKQCKFLANYLESEVRSSFRDINIVPDFAGILRFITGIRL